MYFETPVLMTGAFLGGVYARRSEKWYCCWEGLDAWFKGLDRPGLNLVMCFDTKYVHKYVHDAVQSFADHHTSSALDNLFRRNKVKLGQPIWWWVEIVTDE